MGNSKKVTQKVTQVLRGLEWTVLDVLKQKTQHLLGFLGWFRTSLDVLKPLSGAEERT